jgi:NAD(P)H-flavin reductase
MRRAGLPEKLSGPLEAQFDEHRPTLAKQATIREIRSHRFVAEHAPVNHRGDAKFMSSDNQFYQGRITTRVDFAPDLWSIRVNPGGEFKFRPGQYATLGVQSANKRSERAYSIVSSPHESEVEFFIELVPGGELTPQLYNSQSGNEILMRRVPKGRFLLDTNGSRKNHLLVSTVTGVAPFVNYIRSLLKDDQDGKFLAGNRLFLLNGASRSMLGAEC